MNINEPMTMATDYLLGAVAATLAVRLWRAGNRAWALAFVFTSLASFLGGSYHGFQIEWLWKPTVYAVGLASFFLLAGTHRLLTPVAALKFLVYAVWMARHDDFKYVIADYGLTLLIVGGVALARWIRSRSPEGPWIFASIGVSILAALIQSSRFSLHAHFNHNDLYHLVQIAALWLLYRGGLLIRSWGTALPTTPPT